MNISEYEFHPLTDNSYYLINKVTGEIINDNAIIKEYLSSSNHRKKDTENLVMTVNKSKKFTKSFHNDEYFNVSDVYVMALLYLFSRNLKKFDNCVYINNSKYISNGELMNLVKIKESKLKNTLRYMEQKNIIKRVGRGRNRVIYVNYNIMINGFGVKYYTKLLFEE